MIKRGNRLIERNMEWMSSNKDMVGIVEAEYMDNIPVPHIINHHPDELTLDRVLAVIEYNRIKQLN